MKLQAFMDESYDHKSGAYVLGGHVAPEDVWAAFNKEWENMLLGWKQPYFKISETGGLSQELRGQRFKQIWNAICDHNLFTVTVITNQNDVSQILAETPPYPTNTAYYFCFFTVIQGLLNKLSRENSTDTIEFIFDDMLHEKEVILKIWYAFIADAPDEQTKFIHGPPRFVSDREYPGIQAADYWVGRIRDRVANDGQPSEVFEFINSARLNDTKQHRVYPGGKEELMFYKEGLLERIASGEKAPFFIG